MKEKDIDCTEYLYMKVMLDLWHIIFNEYLNKGKQSMDVHQLGAYIHSNIDRYLNEEEKMGIVASQLSKCDNEAFNQLIILDAAYAVALKIISDINKKLMENDPKQNNPYDAITHPLLFMLWKFCDESGVDFEAEYMHFNACMN